MANVTPQSENAEWFPEIYGKAAVYRIEQARRELWRTLIAMLPDNPLLRKPNARLVFERADLRAQSLENAVDTPVNFVHFRRFCDEEKESIKSAFSTDEVRVALDCYHKSFKDYEDDRSEWRGEEARQFDRLVCWQSRIPIVGYLSHLFAHHYFSNPHLKIIGYHGTASKDAEETRFTGKHIPGTFACDDKLTFDAVAQKLLQIGTIASSDKTFHDVLKAFANVYSKLLSTGMPSERELICLPVFSHNAKCQNGEVFPAMGTFLGWIRLDFDMEVASLNSVAETCENSFKQLFLILSPLLDGFAQRLMVDEVAEVIGNQYKDQEPVAFLSKHLPQMSGWTVAKATVDNAKVPEHNLPFKWNGKNLTVWLRGDYFTDYAVPVHLAPKPTTIIPADDVSKRSLGGHEAYQLRAIYRELASLHKNALHERDIGRAVAAEESYTKNAHQIRKLCERINKDSSKETLDTLRRYFSLTFLSPKNLQGGALIRLASEIYGGGGFGEYFISGNTIQEFIIASYEYSRRIYPVMLNAHNAAESKITLPNRNLVFISGDEFQRKVWSHNDFVERLSAEDIVAGNFDEPQRLQVKIFWFTGLIALWLNILEHSPSESEVTFQIEKDYLFVTNTAKEAVKKGASQHRSHGTEQTLNYYYKHCFPEGVISGTMDFPYTPTNNLFTTRLPIPNYSILCVN